MNRKQAPNSKTKQPLPTMASRLRSAVVHSPVRNETNQGASTSGEQTKSKDPELTSLQFDTEHNVNQSGGILSRLGVSDVTYSPPENLVIQVPNVPRAIASEPVSTESSEADDSSVAPQQPMNNSLNNQDTVAPMDIRYNYLRGIERILSRVSEEP